jgi:hypothetical protein
MPRFPALVLVLAAAVAAGCASVGPTAPATDGKPEAARPTPKNVEPPPPNVNLSGFPLPYRQGYADGCASASGPQRRDAARYSADANYRTGWTDGLALCRKK